MEDKILRMLGSLEYTELMKLKRDLDAGGYLMQHLVGKKLNEVETMHRKICASCGKALSVERDDVLTMLFGDRTIKKKASFCGLDCMETFITDLKEEKYQQLKEL